MTRPKRRTISQRSELTYDVHEFGVNLDSREIFLHSYMEDNEATGEIDYRQAAQFLKNISLLESQSKKPILIQMSSHGGEWNYGMAIYDAIKLSPCRVTVLAHAHARSMSSIILQAAGKRIMMPNADFMVHFGTMTMDGDEKTVISEAEWSKLLDERMLDIYTDRCVGSEKFHRWRRVRIREFIEARMLRGNWYLTARDAVAFGFADAVLGDPGYASVAVLRK